MPGHESGQGQPRAGVSRDRGHGSAGTEATGQQGQRPQVSRGTEKIGHNRQTGSRVITGGQATGQQGQRPQVSRDRDHRSAEEQRK